MTPFPKVKQTLAVTAIGLRAIPERFGASLSVVIGIALVVAVTVSILSMSEGFMRTVRGAGRADRAIVLSQKSQFEQASAIPRDSLVTIADAPGIRKAQDGKPITSAEYLLSVLVIKKNDGLDAYVTLRGVGPEFLSLRPEIRLSSGRFFTPARRELIVGKSAQAQFEGLNVGDTVPLSDGDWTITGTFESNGSANESELLGDAETLLSTLRVNTFHSVTVMLQSPEAFDPFKTALTTNPALKVDVYPELRYLADQAKEMNSFMQLIAYLVGGIMGLGAAFGALNTLYSAVSTRAVEIATLRAIGFGGAAVVVSVLTESLLLSLCGAVLGGLAAWTAFNGNFHATGGLVFKLAVTPSLIGLGIAFALALGLIGGLFPAIRAARLPVADALRAH